jgi:phage gpG-like protein
MNLTLDIDTREVDRLLNGMEKSLTSFAPEMKTIGQQMAAATDRRIRTGDFPPLAPATVKARRRKAARTGKQPVAGFETPLRESDSLLKSLVESGAEGSESYTDNDEAVQGTSKPQARRLQEGFGTMPAREFLTIEPADSLIYQNTLARGLEERVVRVTRSIR